MPRFILPVMVVAIVGLALSVFGLVTLSRRPSMVLPAPAAGRAGAPDDIAIGLSIPAFSMVDQDGVAQSEAILDGRLTVVDFMFTHCPYACPIMTSAMSEAAAKLAGTPVRFLSVSVDPERDSVARLKQYAKEHDCDLSRWTFLRGERAGVEAIVKSALKFELQDDFRVKIPLPDGTSMSNVVHPTKLLLVGPDRRVLAFFESAIPEDVDRLVERARAASAELRPRP